MYDPRGRGALQRYQQIRTECAIESANPGQLIQVLLDGAIGSLAAAKGHMLRREIALKGEQISRALGIIEGLRASLNKEAGGGLAENLHELYDYMERRLLAGNAQNDPASLDEVLHLLGEIKAAWDTITRASGETRNDQPVASI